MTTDTAVCSETTLALAAIDIDVGSAALLAVNSSLGAQLPRRVKSARSVACIGGNFGGKCSRYTAISTCDINNLEFECGSLLRNRTGVEPLYGSLPRGPAGAKREMTKASAPSFQNR